ADVSSNENASSKETVSMLEDLESIANTETTINGSDDDEEDLSEKSETEPKTKLNKDEEEDDDDYEEGDEGEEEVCDTRISSIVRNFNSTPLLPDDYEEAYETVTKIDLINRKYNITDMMRIVQRFIDY